MEDAVPFERTASTKTEQTLTDGSAGYYTPLETPLITPHGTDGEDEDENSFSSASSEGTISTTESFPLPLHVDVEPTAEEEEEEAQQQQQQKQHDQQIIVLMNCGELLNNLKTPTTSNNKKSITNLIPSANTPCSLTRNNDNRRRRRRFLRQKQQQEPQRRATTWTPPPILSRSQSFSILEESLIFHSPIDHMLLSPESVQPNSGDAAEDGNNYSMCNKINEEVMSSPHSPNGNNSQELQVGKPSRDGTTANDGKEREGKKEEVSKVEICLDAALMKFSALPDLDLHDCMTNDACSSEQSSDNTATITKFQWLSLLARWKHQEMEKAIMSWPTLDHYFQIQQRGNAISMIYNNTHTNEDDDDIQILSSYVSELGPLPCCCCELDSPCTSSSNGGIAFTNEGENPEFLVVNRNGKDHRWDWSYDGNRYTFQENIRQGIESCLDDSASATVSSKVKDLISIAEKSLPLFRSILQSICSSFNSDSTTVQNPPLFYPTWTASVKSRERILQKAITRYHGDVTQVKDILRGYVIAPNDCSLVCALMALLRLEKSCPIIRIKNLFRVTNLGALVPTNLPTGYRHILVSIRLENGLLAEIQFHLLQMYDLVGPMGHELHQYLMGYWTSDCSATRCEDLLKSYKQKNPNSLPDRNIFRTCSCSESLCDISIGPRAVDRIISYGIHELSANKWDTGIHMCLSKLLQIRFLSQRENQRDKVAAISLLRRAVEIADRNCSIGMFGWEAYGMSNPLDRIASRSIDILYEHASFQAVTGDWRCTSDICTLLLSKCERQLSMCHPRTIAALLDLAASLSCITKGVDSQKSTIIALMQRANSRVSCYLEQQTRVLSKVGKQEERDGESDNFKDFVNKRAAALRYLRAYVSKLLALLNRPMVSLFGSSHPTKLYFHSFIADTLAVLALHSEVGNAVSTQDDSHFNLQSTDFNSSLFWSCAGHHYRKALTGWIILHGRKVSHAPVLCCGLARCLWELGKGQEAFVLISRVLGPYEQNGSKHSPQCCSSDVSDFNVDGAYIKSLAFSIWWLCTYFSQKSIGECCAEDRSLCLHIMKFLGKSADFLQNKVQQSGKLSNGLVVETIQKCEEATAIIKTEIARLSTLS